MNDFMQMNIFFFVSSISSIILLVLATIIGVYVFLIVKKIHRIVEDMKELSAHISQKTSETTDTISSKVEALMSNVGPVEKTIATILGIILAQSISFRGKMKRDVRKDRK